MELSSAILLGLIGSLHCAGMCGPLALALPNSGMGWRFYAGRFGYNLGRITAYALLGLVFGLAGRSIALAGFQRWTSLVAGAAILAALVPVARHGLSLPAFRAVAWLKTGFALLLRRRTLFALYLMGVLNGFLPCGLVYVACAGAMALGTVLSGVTYMVAFGLGTVPLMLGIGILGRNVQLTIRFRLQKLVPLSLAVVGTLLVLRGLDLGIPYLSPAISLPGAAHDCH